MKINKAAARADFKKQAAKFRREAEMAEKGAARFREQGKPAAAKTCEDLAKVYLKQADMAENYKFPKWVK
ncbi:hypothetical protein [Nocardioides panzhihuensis]|uniref:Uncharacterized protein n=1 Tax=Nocardioides panzhihuensis TaxID=860243 RepID=A0A7Z0DSL7_9ACTN|nr:hypothetical protein [Nocardioides panzhihuensis]NYI80888.1 hypothetical protein [Nocardioides panzhihuensis]NYI81279.1 hypothetical protein [Nocardioides panzhihuensis]NYI81316.1 hypothetical protein [Nocardioides panzhihuensis]NYI81334.1 hypothetical protein [Nocardioides panzhihuensis]NYI81353.1 hypothetical protein [Nocardioides panzhihuensis]